MRLGFLEHLERSLQEGTTMKQFVLGALIAVSFTAASASNAQAQDSAPPSSHTKTATFSMY